MAVKPLDDRVLVKQCDAEDVTSGGIVLPDTAREKQQRGIVLEVGPGRLLDSGKRGKMNVKKGDEVYYAKFAGTELKLNDEEVVIIRESDILAVVD